MTPRKRASLYTRLSVAADDENTSLEGAIDDMRALCAREGLDIIEPIHVDDGRTGGRRDRAEFQAWLDDARSGRAQVLVNPVTDRLTREGLNVAASILDVVEGKDTATGRVVHKPVRLIDTKGLDSEHGDSFRMRFVLQAEIARSERERVRDRTRLSVRRLRRANRWPGGTPPFGYRAVDNPEGPGKVLEPDPAEAEALHECARRILTGQPLGTVTRWLNTQEVKPRRAPEFSRQVLRKILMGDALAGRITVNGKVAEGVSFPPILTAGESAALRTALKTEPGTQYSGGRHPERLLSGLLTCSGCGGPLRVGKRSQRPVYRCDARSQGKTCGQAVTTSCEPIEQHVTSEVLALIGNKPMTRQEVRVSGLDDLAVVEQEIQDVLAQVAQAATVEAVSRLQALQQERDELRAVEPEQTVVTVDMGMTGAEWWEKALLEEKRGLVADMWPHMVLLPGRRGPKGFDPARLVRHSETDGEFEVWLSSDGGGA